MINICRKYKKSKILGKTIGVGQLLVIVKNFSTITMKDLELLLVEFKDIEINILNQTLMLKNNMIYKDGRTSMLIDNILENSLLTVCLLSHGINLKEKDLLFFNELLLDYEVTKKSEVKVLLLDVIVKNFSFDMIDDFGSNYLSIKKLTLKKLEFDLLETLNLSNHDEFKKLFYHNIELDPNTIVDFINQYSQDIVNDYPGFPIEILMLKYIKNPNKIITIHQELSSLFLNRFFYDKNVTNVTNYTDFKYIDLWLFLILQSLKLLIAKK